MSGNHSTVEPFFYLLHVHSSQYSCSSTQQYSFKDDPFILIILRQYLVLNIHDHKNAVLELFFFAFSACNCNSSLAVCTVCGRMTSGRPVAY